ncbi:MAG: solute carrier family 23 protein [Desulfobacteraceae bacterium]|jgi:xanthine/uracil permease|nr:solute carrier family 23 protein [Desulfobacteraceae bacterium]
MATGKILDRAFPPFFDVPREKPRDMLYIANEKPDRLTTLVAGAQHVLIILMLSVYVVFVGREIGLTGAQLRSFVSIEIVVIGIATLLQSLKTRFSSGHLMIHAPNLMSIAALGVVALNFGLGAAAGAYLLSGVVVIVLARFLPNLQKVFPPEVSGILLVLLGLTLVKGGAVSFTGYQDGMIDWVAFIVASVALGTIVVVSIWTSEKIRVFAVAIGVAAGIAIAAVTGVFGAEQLTVVYGQPFVALPFEGYDLPRPTLVFGAVLPLLVIEIISAVGTIGKGVAIDKLNNAKWKRPDLPMIGRLVMCQGVGVLLNGLTGTPSTVTNSANIGLAHSTGVTARRVGTAAGILFVIAACLPMLSTFITIIPRPVMGAIIVYTAGFLIVAGMQMILSRMINNRRMFMVGLSVTVGAAIILMPELASMVPPGLEPILGSGLTMGILTAVTLNLIFRIGIAKTEEIVLAGPVESLKGTRFLEDCGIAWGARHDVIARAGQSMMEALEALHEAKLMEGPATLTATFDEYKIALAINYPGRGISLSGKQTVDLKRLMAAGANDEAIDAAMSNMSAHLLRKLADRVNCDEKDNRATLHLQFNH